jgi:ribosome recycling factor
MSENTIPDILSATHAKMRKAIEALTKELASIRTGRASPVLVSEIKVDYHGIPTPINQLAGISVPEARSLLVQPWDRSALSSIEKAILKSDLGLNPASDGNVIRLTIPPLTEERRRELVKVLGKKIEGTKIELRNLRREAMREVRELERKKEASQDELQRALEQLQELTDSHIEEVDRVWEGKERELMET